jgi:hypothetical protein
MLVFQQPANSRMKIHKLPIFCLFIANALSSCCSLLNVTPDYDYNYEPLAGTVVHQDGSPAFDVSISDVMFPFVPDFSGDSTASDTSGNYFFPTGYVEIVKDANGDCSGGKKGIARDTVFSVCRFIPPRIRSWFFSYRILFTIGTISWDESRSTRNTARFTSGHSRSTIAAFT